MNKTILIIEDDKKVYEMIASVVDQYGIIIHERAVDGAIGALDENGSFDLVIVDLKIVARGLTSSQMVDYRDMEGYAFLKEFYWKRAKDNVEQEHRKETTIICSKYKTEFEKRYPEESKNIILISKSDGFINKLKQQVKRIFKE